MTTLPDDSSTEAGGATPTRGGASARPDESTRLTGRLPAEDAFLQEYPGADLPSTMLARAMERLGSAVESAVTAVWRQHGISHAAGNALAVIEGWGGPMAAGEIAAAMHITSGSITSLVDTLVKAGLVERTAHQGDRRKVLVSLTPAGVALLDEALPEIQQLVKVLFGGLDEDERRQFLALSQRAYASILNADLEHVPEGTRHRPT